MPRRKVDGVLTLPLTDEAGTAVLDYVRHGRPTLATGVLFLRVRPSAGLLKPTAVTEVFQTRARHSGLTLPFQGPHCLRHSLAVGCCVRACHSRRSVTCSDIGASRAPASICGSRRRTFRKHDKHRDVPSST